MKSRSIAQQQQVEAWLRKGRESKKLGPQKGDKEPVPYFRMRKTGELYGHQEGKNWVGIQPKWKKTRTIPTEKAKEMGKATGSTSFFINAKGKMEPANPNLVNFWGMKHRSPWK